MKFSHVPVEGFEDATRNFEELQRLLRNVQDLTLGTVNVTFTASNQTPAVTVTHGLKKSDGSGLAPAGIWLQDAGSAGAGAANFYTAFTATATTFQVQGQSSVAITTTRTLYWLAIG